MKTLRFLFLLLLVPALVKAQDYNTAIGIRGGYPYGITLKHFISGEAALEGILAGRWGGATITGLYEKHTNAFGVDNLYWFYGAGAHAGFYHWGPGWDRWGRWNGTYHGTHFTVGIDGIIGLEYQISEIPFTISVDYKPALSFIPFGFLFDEGAFSLRYYF